MSRTVTRVVAGASCTLATAMLVGCSGLTPGAGTDNGAGATTAGRKLTADEVRKAGQITLSMADYESTEGPSQALDKDIAQFEASFPNVSINRVAKGFADYSKTINLQMSSNNPPDIAELNIITNPKLIKTGLLRPLDDYYAAYGWEQRQNYPDTALGILKADSAGATFGSGSWYALGASGNMIGVYYNKQMLKDLGLGVPQTFAEFEGALKAAKSRGKVPIQLGNLDQIPAAFAIATVLTQFEDPKKVSDWVYGVEGSTLETPGVIEGFAKLGEWAEKGYFPSQANGTKDDDAVSAFVTGNGLFTFSGTWRLAQIDQRLGDRAGFMLLPPREPGGKVYASGAVQSPFTISAKSKHPDVAAFFLDYLIGPECAKNNLAGGLLPFGTTVPAATGGPASQEAMAAWGNALETGVLSPSLDWATPSMGDTEFPGLQALIGRKKTGKAVVAEMQSNWADFHG